MKHVFITGATSMVGIALLEKCIENQVYATILTRENSLNNHRLPQSEYINYIYEDITNLKYVVVEQKFDVFYHLGWTGTDKIQRNSALKQYANIQITLDAIYLAKKIGCTKFIGTGSQAEYGRVSGIVSSDTPVNPDTAYGIAKYTAGKLGSILAKEIGLEFVWGRIFSVYGIHDNPHTMISSCISNLLQKKEFLLTPCEQIWNYLFSEDVGEALYSLGIKGKDQSFYCIGHPKSYPLKKYLAIIAEQLQGKEYIKIGALEYSPFQVMNLSPDVSSLQIDTGFTPSTSFEEGIKKTVSFLKDNSK